MALPPLQRHLLLLPLASRPWTNSTERERAGSGSGNSQPHLHNLTGRQPFLAMLFYRLKHFTSPRKDLRKLANTHSINKTEISKESRKMEKHCGGNKISAQREAPGPSQTSHVARVSQGGRGISYRSLRAHKTNVPMRSPVLSERGT